MRMILRQKRLWGRPCTKESSCFRLNSAGNSCCFFKIKYYGPGLLQAFLPWSWSFRIQLEKDGTRHRYCLAFFFSDPAPARQTAAEAVIRRIQSIVSEGSPVAGFFAVPDVLPDFDALEEDAFLPDFPVEEEAAFP